MPFIDTVPLDTATGATAELYRQDLEAGGFVANHTRALSLRPDAVLAFRQLNRAIKKNMSPRRYELVTLAAARALRSSYCMITHGSALRRLEGWNADALAEVARAPEQAGLDAAELAVMAFAEKLSTDATSMTQDDVDGLRSLGLSDEEVLDVAMTASLRNFYSRLLDAVGAQADARYEALEPVVKDALVVGRPIQSAA